nr:MAG: hypothetical protein [Bacteriophage sp.]
MIKINEKKFCSEKELNYRNEVLQILNSLCSKGVTLGLNEEEETLRKEINRMSDKYYFGR